jgi:hypothetical protein
MKTGGAILRRPFGLTGLGFQFQLSRQRREAGASSPFLFMRVVVPDGLAEIHFLWRRYRADASADDRAWNGANAAKDGACACADCRARRHAVAQLRAAGRKQERRTGGENKLTHKCLLENSVRG